MDETVVFSGSYIEEADAWLLQSNNSEAQIRFKKSDVYIEQNVINVRLGAEGNLVKKPFAANVADPTFGAHYDSNCKGRGTTYCIAGIRFCCDGDKVVGGCKVFDHWGCA